MKLKKSKFIKISRDIAILFVIFMAIGLYMKRNAVSGQSPMIQGVLLSNAPVSLVQLRGKPVLIHFWATWCRICRYEQDGIDDIARDYQVVTVSMSSGTKKEVQTYMLNNGLTFPVLNDPDAVLSKRYGVKGVPASFILDAQGKIRFTEIGYTSEWGLRFRLWLATFY